MIYPPGANPGNGSTCADLGSIYPEFQLNQERTDQ
jgi:hypothetical protein